MSCLWVGANVFWDEFFGRLGLLSILPLYWMDMRFLEALDLLGGFVQLSNIINPQNSLKAEMVFGGFG